MSSRLSCIRPRIFLTNPDPAAYALVDEITVARHVLIQGHPVFLPVIDAGAQLTAVLAGVTLPDIAVCTIGSTLQRRLLIPAYNSHESLQIPSFFQTPIEREKPTSLTSTIRLVDPTRPGLPFAGGLH